jgi:succinate dehydrogenase / fumarate reductase cytochrome b subunit
MYNYSSLNHVKADNRIFTRGMTFMAEMTIKKRPKNLDLTTIKLPLPGKVSILHRVSGAGLVPLYSGVALAVRRQFDSPESFASFRPLLRCCLSRLFWLV